MLGEDCLVNPWNLNEPNTGHLDLRRDVVLVMELIVIGSLSCK